MCIERVKEVKGVDECGGVICGVVVMCYGVYTKSSKEALFFGGGISVKKRLKLFQEIINGLF